MSFKQGPLSRDLLSPQNQRRGVPTPITALRGPYSVCLRTSRRTRPSARFCNERDDPIMLSALTWPLMRTQVFEP